MPIIHIAELARLTMDYLCPAEAFTLGLLLGDTFPKTISDHRIPKYRDLHRFTAECMQVVVWAGWTAGPAKLVERFPEFPQFKMVTLICAAFTREYIAIAVEMHKANISICARRLKVPRENLTRQNAAIELVYSTSEVESLAAVAVAAELAPTLIGMLGPKCKQHLLMKAAKKGNFGMLNYLYSPDEPWHGQSHGDKNILFAACQAAARGGHIPAFEYLMRRSKYTWGGASDSDGLTSDEMSLICNDAAVRRGFPGAAEWLGARPKGPPPRGS